MTRKEQNKILDDKIESNINQYKVDRLNAEISAFSSGDLNKYEFLTRKDLKYKPNALDKARFEFSPLGKTFSTGLDKNADGYQEEGVIKLLKDIRDGLAGGNVDDRPDRPDDRSDDRPDRPDDRPDRPDDRPDRPDDRPDEQYYEKKENIAINYLLNKIDNINKKYKDTIDNINEQNNDYLKKIEEQNDDIEKLKKEVRDNKELTEDILYESGEKIDKFYKEKLKYYIELKYEIERNSKIIEERDNILYDISRHIRDNINENEINRNVLERDLERLINLNKEYLDEVNNLNKKY